MSLKLELVQRASEDAVFKIEPSPYEYPANQGYDDLAGYEAWWMCNHGHLPENHREYH